MAVDYTPSFDPADVDSDYGSTGGDITVPTFTANMKPFRFWCQRALPLVYDDSLSYYEVLCKVVDQMNGFLTDLQTATGSIGEFAQQFVVNQQFLNDMADQLGKNVEDLETYINNRMDDFTAAYQQLQSYVNNYFDNLDVQQEINTKLDAMAADGTFNTLFNPVITAWMTAKTAQIDSAIANQDAIQAQQNGRISVLEGRMNGFSSLPAGSTSGNAELLDIRTNFLGETYPSAGDAVRSSDMIVSGFQSIGFTRLTNWDGNGESSVVNTIVFDVSSYKGGHVVVIANMESFVQNIVNGSGISLYGSNVAGKTVDNSARQYPFPDGFSGTTNAVFKSYAVISTSIQGEERIMMQLSIPNDFAFQYLKLGDVEVIPQTTHTTPEAIVYASSWSKTPVDATLSIAGDAADAKATGDAAEALNDRLLTFGVNKNILGEYANVLYPVYIKANIPFTVSRADGENMSSLSGVRIFAYGADRAQLNWWGLDVNATKRTISWPADIYFISVNSTTVKLQVEIGSVQTAYQKYTEPYSDFINHVFRTYGNISNSNYTNLLPSKKLSDIPVNTVSYISADLDASDRPEAGNLVVLTYVGYAGYNYARLQECYCVSSNKVYRRYSADGSSWGRWNWNIETTLHTYANINSSNYSSLLPQKTLASIPSNTISYIAADVGVTDAPETGSAMFVRTSSGYSGLAYAKYQECFILYSRQVYFRYSNDNSSWDKWQKLSETFTDALKDNYVQTVVDKPITLDANTGLYIFGDSITTDTHGGFTWASLIASKLGCTEYNFGVGGSNFISGGILSQVNGVSDWSNADVVIVAAGTNERLSGSVTPATLRTAVQNVITAIKTNAPNAKIVFITPIRRTFYQLTEIIEISSCIMNVAMLNKCSVISGGDIPVVLTADENDWMIGFDDDDNLHPNSDGKWVYATSVLNALL